MKKDGGFERTGILIMDRDFERTGFLKMAGPSEKHGVLTSLTWVFGRTGFLKKARVFDVTNNVTTKDDLTTDSNDNQHGVNNEILNIQEGIQSVGNEFYYMGTFFHK